MLTHGSALPFAPFCFPRARPESLARFATGFTLSGRSSLDGGIEEFPLFRETTRSSRRTRSSNAALAARNWRITAISSSRESSSKPNTAQDHHRSQLPVTDDTPKINYQPECLPLMLANREADSLEYPVFTHVFTANIAVGPCRWSGLNALNEHERSATTE
jgi:hypothetical protein